MPLHLVRLVKSFFLRCCHFWLGSRARNCHIREDLLSRSQLPSLNLSLQWWREWHSARLGSMGCRPLSSDLIGFLSSPQCGELIEPIRSDERCPQPIDPQVASSPSLRGRLCREQRETRARTRVVTRSLSVKNPGPVLRGTLSHAIRREFPTPHPISEFSSATDKSASSPGCSISAAPIDLAAARTCSPRMAPRYREAFVTVSSRRSFSVSELHLKDFDRCDALT